MQVIFFDSSSILRPSWSTYMTPCPLLSSIFVIYHYCLCAIISPPPSISIICLFLAVAVQSHFFFSIVQCNLYYTTVITLMTVRNICRRNRQKIISVWTSHIICIFAFIYGMYDRTSKVYLSRHLVLEEFDDELVSLSIGLSSRTTRELQ